jgi:hypothetical protein
MKITCSISGWRDGQNADTSPKVIGGKHQFANSKTERCLYLEAFPDFVGSVTHHGARHKPTNPSMDFRAWRPPLNHGPTGFVPGFSQSLSNMGLPNRSDCSDHGNHQRGERNAKRKSGHNIRSCPRAQVDQTRDLRLVRTVAIARGGPAKAAPSTNSITKLDQPHSRLRRVRGKALASSLLDDLLWSFVDLILPREPCRGVAGFASASRPFPIRLCS